MTATSKTSFDCSLLSQLVGCCALLLSIKRGKSPCVNRLALGVPVAMAQDNIEVTFKGVLCKVSEMSTNI